MVKILISSAFLSKVTPVKILKFYCKKYNQGQVFLVFTQNRLLTKLLLSVVFIITISSINFFKASYRITHVEFRQDKMTEHFEQPF